MGSFYCGQVQPALKGVCDGGRLGSGGEWGRDEGRLGEGGGIS